MSIITVSALLDQISGRIGSVIFCRDGIGGPYVRGFGPVFNPATPYQEQVRSLLAATSKAWADLTATNRKNWNDFAKAHKWINRLAQETSISGIDWFCKLSFQANYYAEAGSPAVVLTNPPAGLNVKPLTKMKIVSASAATNRIIVTLTPAPAVHAGTLQGFMLSTLMRPGQTTELATQFAFVQPNDEDPSQIDYNHDVGRYPTPVAGDRCIIEAFRITHATGVMTNPVALEVTWAA